MNDANHPGSAIRIVLDDMSRYPDLLLLTERFIDSLITSDLHKRTAVS